MTGTEEKEAKEAQPPLVLVVEDDPVQQLMASASLERANYRVICAADGSLGMSMARNEHPDIIVCDVVMPGMNGFQLLTAVRREPGLTDVPVIMLTSMAERAHVRIAMTAGADDYLPKPFKPAELSEAVAAVLAKRAALRSHAAGEVKEQIAEALDWQKDTLTQQYEVRLMKELNSRWADTDKHNEEIAYPDCTIVAVNLFSAILARHTPGADMAAAVRKGFEMARDTLYLFGARHLIPQGQDLLAVFVADEGTDVQAMPLRALRSAAGLLKGPHREAAENRAIGVHAGPATLLQITDPLHGDAVTLVTGETARIASLLMDYGRQSGWRITCSGSLMEGMGEQVKTGRSQRAPCGESGPAQAIELLSVS